MKTKYKIEHWNEHFKMWFFTDTGEDEAEMRAWLEKLRKTEPTETYRLIKIDCTEEVVG